MAITNDGVVTSGYIVQTVNTTTQSEAETSGTTFIDTNLEHSITPIAANSKILVIISQQLAINTSDSGNGGGLNINRKVINKIILYSFSIIKIN